MNILFNNLHEQYRMGMEYFLKRHKITHADGGLNITIKTTYNRKTRITRNKNNVVFELDRAYQVFRAITLLEEHCDNENFSLEENCYFDTLCAMFDGSQASSLMTIDSCKKMMLILAGMGYNAMMLYCEDCYSVEGEPYWGNMRPRYSPNEFRELDDFAYSLGIELIPCIQTLGHLSEAIKKPPYSRIADTEDTLMVGNEDVYNLIEKLIVHMSSCFRSKRIHLGLDEAWNLGLGNYLRKNGYHTQTEIMLEHVQRVYDIANKHNLKPMMWADMYFRAKHPTGGYGPEGVSFTEEEKSRIPKNMELIYWDYYKTDYKDNELMIGKHKELTDNIVFAGCSRNVRTFGSHHNLTVATTNAALKACKNKGIKEIIATVWGDDHRESSTFATLPGLQLYAEHMYSESPSEDFVEKRFKTCTGADYTPFADIGRFDCIPEYNGNNLVPSSPSKVCLWQDIMLGLCDYDLQNMDFSEHYKKLKEDMLQYAKSNYEFKYVFDFYAQLAAVLETKAYMGLKVTAAYKSKNLDELKTITENDLPNLFKEMSKLRLIHRQYFFEEYKPIGWEVLDIRYGGAIMRIDTAIARLSDYINGKIDHIDELEEERLSFTGEGKLIPNIKYMSICSASRLTS